MIRLIRSELMKVRTTNVWLVFTIGVLLSAAIMAIIWINVGSSQIDEARIMFAVPEELSPKEKEEWIRTHDLGPILANTAAQIYTSGQFLGILFVMLLGAIVVTNEYHHQTATATFLATPKRTKVIVAKLITAISFAGFYWLVTTVFNGVLGILFFFSEGYDPQLGDWTVIRAVLMNGLAFGLWGILGVALGVLIRNQIGAVITGSVLYVVGSYAIILVYGLIYAFWIKKQWILSSMVIWPSMASQIMVSPEKVYPQSPDWWVGALVLVGYGIVFGTIGTMIARKRDVS
ncbi:ABC transporter permease [Allorhizocola rhizosphaerae]|uniref:ABC transporter permease n=1 Tax=Allorhizocola rhizosphaerae TaxID=1872709 RepID=UPI000E3EA5AC|nr:ABC transporter permease [Allorhizocola rhizosphaerae]